MTTIEDLTAAIPDPSPQQRMVIEVAAYDLRLLQKEAAMALAGKGVDPEAWALHRTGLFAALKMLGLARRAKPLKRLADVIAEHDHAEQASAPTPASPPAAGFSRHAAGTEQASEPGGDTP